MNLCSLAYFSCPLAEVGKPLFGNQWLALLAALAGVALLMFAVAATGRWLAATHPTSPPRATAPAAPAYDGPTPEVLVVIAAAISATFGRQARIAEVHAIKPVAPSVESLMQQWSVEGRRQIYSSHQIR
jgi:hypothetical protein